MNRPVSRQLFECFTLDRHDGRAPFLLRTKAFWGRAAKSLDAVYHWKRSGTLSV
jgi:hypothetical protein